MSTAAESVSEHVAAQQKKWEDYLTQHGVEKIYRDMTAEMISEQPASPVSVAGYVTKNVPPLWRASGSRLAGSV